MEFEVSQEYISYVSKDDAFYEIGIRLDSAAERVREHDEDLAEELIEIANFSRSIP